MQATSFGIARAKDIGVSDSVLPEQDGAEIPTKKYKKVGTPSPEVGSYQLEGLSIEAAVLKARITE